MKVRGFALAETDLTSFDRQFRARALVQRPDRYRLLDALPADAQTIARGSGVSYVAASFGEDVISQELRAFDRLLGFDQQSGRLALEAGACIGDVQRFALAHGWYLPVAPGHPKATIGGCIAADVHGKNPARDGTFRAQVEAIELVAAERGTLVASATRNTELFHATFAGFGLTGTITRATLQLARPPAALVLRRVPVRTFADAARVLRAASNAPVAYGWHDGRAARFGRGIINIGLASNPPAGGRMRLPSAARDLAADIPPWRVPVWNRASIAAANTWLDAHWRRNSQQPLALEDALFPLNDARAYFAGFGAAGLAEAQWLIPNARFEAFAEALGDLVQRMRPRITLIASKLFAGAADGLRFDGDGIALAIQLPAPATASQRGFLEALADIAIAHAGRPNLIKDCTLDADTVRRALPDFEAARTRLAVHNPGNVRSSELARRIAL